MSQKYCKNSYLFCIIILTIISDIGGWELQSVLGTLKFSTFLWYAGTRIILYVQLHPLLSCFFLAKNTNVRRVINNVIINVISNVLGPTHQTDGLAEGLLLSYSQILFQQILKTYLIFFNVLKAD